MESPTNQVFAVIPNEIKPQVDEVCDCEVWCPYDESHTVIRFVTCFHTSQEDVDGLLAALAQPVISKKVPGANGSVS